MHMHRMVCAYVRTATIFCRQYFVYSEVHSSTCTHSHTYIHFTWARTLGHTVRRRFGVRVCNFVLCACWQKERCVRVCNEATWRVCTTSSGDIMQIKCERSASTAKKRPPTSKLRCRTCVYAHLSMFRVCTYNKGGLTVLRIRQN